MHEIALVCVLALEGHDSPDVATSYTHIGIVYYRQGQYERALEYYQKVLEINIKVSGQDHPEVATSFINIGAVYAGKGDFENALVQYQKGLEIKTRVFGSDHPDVAKTRSPDHPDVAKTRSSVPVAVQVVVPAQARVRPTRNKRSARPVPRPSGPNPPNNPAIRAV
jgi:Tfp pilus assembly protein PilF